MRLCRPLVAQGHAQGMTHRDKDGRMVNAMALLAHHLVSLGMRPGPYAMDAERKTNLGMTERQLHLTAPGSSRGCQGRLRAVGQGQRRGTAPNASTNQIFRTQHPTNPVKPSLADFKVGHANFSADFDPICFQIGFWIYFDVGNLENAFWACFLLG